MIARVLRILPGPVARIAVLGVLASALFVASAAAGPTLGFLENWPGTSLQGWGGGADLANPGAGGMGGAGDGYLLVSTPFPAHLGAMSVGPEYAGDWMAAKVNVVKVWLNDVNAADPLEIHFSIGNAFNFWQYNVGFSPPHNAWKEFAVDLTSSANFTRIIGQGTYEAALQSVDRIHLRHDLSPYAKTPDFLTGDFGIDRLLLTSDAVPVAPISWGRLKSLYR
jgi:hypothetical protein